jgi:hypothetical protein
MSHLGMTDVAQPATKPDVRNTRLIRGKMIRVQHVELPHEKLRFYEENPRVHSIMRADGREPTQLEIETHMIGLDHVKKLANEIEAEGGLHDAVIVRGGTMEVLEGNRRLAAYRLLSRRSNGAKWATMLCELLPTDIDEDLVFSLLAQYHINGKLAWQPFEQAGFFLREYLADQSAGDHDQKIEALAARGGGISKRRADHLVQTYGFMLDHDDAVAEHWSHYDEYFKSREIGKARALHADLDDRFVEAVPTIPAEDVRKKLAKICAQERVLKKFVSGAVDLEGAYQLYQESGASADAYQKFSKFRTWLADDDVRREITQYAGQERQRVLLEVKKLELLLSRLHSSMTQEPPPTRRKR